MTILDEISYGPLDFDNQDEVMRAAEIHESAPINWKPGFVVADSRIHECAISLKKCADDAAVFVLTARSQSKEIIGFHWLDIVEKYGEKSGHIRSLWTSTKHRNRGIAGELKRHGEDWARLQGAKFITTEVFYANKKMIEYNLKLGFVARQVEMLKDL